MHGRFNPAKFDQVAERKIHFFPIAIELPGALSKYILPQKLQSFPMLIFQYRQFSLA